MLRILTAWLLLTTMLWSQTALTPGVQVATGSQVVHANTAIQVTHQAEPTWTYVGTIPTIQAWGCVFDNSGYMWCGSNNLTTGGVFVSYNKGATWSTVTPSTISGCPSVRGVGLAPDGTVFIGQQACSTIHLYWVNNVANPTGPYTWTRSTQNGGYSLAGDGPEIRFDIAADGQTIYVGTGVVSSGNNSVVLTSTDNARSFTLAAGSPTHTKISELLGAKTIGGYEYMSLSIASGTNNPCCDSTSGEVWYSSNNGATWSGLGWPSAMTGCKPTTNCSLDAAWATVVPGIGSYLGMPIAFFGASGSATGIYGYNSTTPGSGSWNALSGPWPAAITSLATNRTQNMIVGNFYEDSALVPIYTINATAWNYAGTGISCVSGQQACSTATSNAGYRTAYTLVDPSTGVFYITTKLNKSGTPNTGSDVYSSGTSLDNPNNGYITPVNQTLVDPGTQQYTMNLTYQDTTTGTTCPAPSIVVWSSSNSSVATIGLSGLATTGASTGTTTISGTCNGITMTNTTLTYADRQ